MRDLPQLSQRKNLMDLRGLALLVGVDGSVLGWGRDECDAAHEAFRAMLRELEEYPDEDITARLVLETLAEAEFVYVVSKSDARIEQFLKMHSLNACVKA